MNLDSLNRWLTLIANVGVLAGIFTVALELSQTQTAMQAEASSTRSQMDMNNRRLSYDLGIRDIAQKLSTGQELTAEEIRRVNLREATMLRYFENLHYQMEIGVLDEQIWDANLQAISSYCNSPLFNAAFPNWENGASRAFRMDFVNLINSYCTD
ncbi:MAG: hypothetical protein R3F50_04765 [Gammaproteobacteria bacterium]